MKCLHRSISYQQFLSNILLKQTKLHINKTNKLTTSLLSHHSKSIESSKNVEFWFSKPNQAQKRTMASLNTDEKTDTQHTTPTEPSNVGSFLTL